MARSLAKSVFPTPVGPKKQEGADGPVRIFDIGTAAADGSADSLDSFILADDIFFKDFFHFENFLRLAFGQTAERNPCLLCDD